MTTVRVEKLHDATSFIAKETRIVPTGTINIKANINVNIDTGTITITDEKGRIKFSFDNIRMAKQWADAVR